MASIPAYGSNVSNFDPNNPQHIALADAGQQWAQAKAAGDTAGMSAAKALGDQIRSGVQGSSYESKTGVSVLPTQPTTVNPPVSAQTANNTNPIYSGFSNDQLKQESAYQAEKDRLAKQRAMETAIALLNTSKDRLFTDINEDRTLQNVQMDNSLSPFSGKSDYARGLIGMQRERTDREINEDYASKVSQAQQGYTDFLGTLSEYERQLYTDLLRREREYGLQYGGLMGELPNGGGKTLAAQQFDWEKSSNNPVNQGQIIQNQINQLKLQNLPQELKLGLQDLENRVKSGQIDIKTAEYQLNELKDPNSATNRAKALDLQMKELEAKNMPEQQRLELQKLRKQIAEIGKVPVLTDHEKQMQEIKLETAKAELAKLQNGSTPTKLDPKESADNVLEAKGYMDSLSKDDSISYLQRTKPYFTDSDYNALIKWIEDNK